MGFIPKWMVVNLLTMNNPLLLTFILISFTLVTLFFYLRICYSGLMLNNFEPKWINNYQINNFQMNLYMCISSVSILGLPFISLLYFMF